eukprot:scaffold2110_cov333-Pavlova_lutheri.AAC.1
MRAPCQSRSKENRHDVLWRKKVGEKDVLLGVHIIGRSPSTRGLPSRSMRRGLQVKNKTGLHGFLLKGTWLPGAIYGLEYTQKEVSHFKQKYNEDKNIMWALEHSLVELPPMTPREHSMPHNAVIVPDLRWSGAVIMINNSDQPNCRLFVDIAMKGPKGRYFWKIYFQTTKDVPKEVELTAKKGQTRGGEIAGF